MEIKQKLELKKLLLPELQQSLKILPLSLLELKSLVETELVNNPFLEEIKPAIIKKNNLLSSGKNKLKADLDFLLGLMTQKTSLQESLLEELGMFTNTDIERKIGEEIIGNIDENGYLKVTLEEIASSLKVTIEQVERILKLIQQFEPAGVGARTIQECLLLQIEASGDTDPLIKGIITHHLDDIAKKNYTHIAKTLKQPLSAIEPIIKKILKLDPKPGRNYSIEEVHRLIPDIIIDANDEDFEITINDEDIPALSINKDYRQLLKDKSLDQHTKEFLSKKLKSALELLRAISKRQDTLRRIIETVAEVQQDAIKEDLSYLKPLTLQDVANKLQMHESTVSRAITNKYVKLPYGTVALKDFFSGGIEGQNGQEVSSNFVKFRIKELIDREDKKHPLSDEDIAGIILKHNALKVARRTITKYREELKLLSSTFRRER
jgi:RNA polymerase sigma-54 factor